MKTPFDTTIKNALSFDLEDWFCAHNLGIHSRDWDKCELRVFHGTRRILKLLTKHDTRATFFVLGWVADRAPELIREIEDRGHEIGVHGYNHLLLTEITESEFERDLAGGLDAIQRTGVRQKVLGFRAPSFTVVPSTRDWACRILEKYEFRYDSSVFPVGFHPDYGIPDAPLAPYKISEALYEFPLSCIDRFGMRLPFSGGGYFRLFPYTYTRLCIRRCNRLGRPALFYLHPWELDSRQPKMALPMLKQIRHYFNLSRTEARLDKLLSEFEFGPIREVLGI